ncbi:FH protein interacting protein FIP2 [Pelomyxa schiedti]|nr:FH protein interacting protein FIP2 [Pelomyxa schiedti]
MDMEQLDAAFAAIKKQMAEQKQRDQAELEEVKKRDMAELADKRDKMMALVEEERARLKTEWDWVSLATGKSSRSPCDEGAGETKLGIGEVVKLNVGGVRYDTTIKTLQKYGKSRFVTLFSGEHPLQRDSDDCFFLDTDGKRFAYVLNFLRRGFVSIPKGKEHLVRELLYEADFFGLEEMKVEIKKAADYLGCTQFYNLFPSESIFIPEGITFTCASGGGSSGSHWNWNSARRPSSLFSIQGNEVSINQTMRFLCFVRLPGVSSSGNNGHADIYLSGSSIAQYWRNEPSGYVNQIFFNQVVEATTGTKLSIYNNSLGDGYDHQLSSTSSLLLLPLRDTVPVLQCSSTTNSGNCWYWTQKAECEPFTVANQIITIKPQGTYLVLVRVTGSSTGGYVQLNCAGSSIAQCYMNERNSYSNSAIISEVVPVQVPNTQLTVSFNSYNPTQYGVATELSVLGPLSGDSYISFSCSAAASPNQCYKWQFRHGCSALARVESGSSVSISRAGLYLAIVRITGSCSSGNSGWAELQVNGIPYAQAFIYNPNSYWNTVHFSEVLEVQPGWTLSVCNRGLGTYNICTTEVHTLILIHM